MKQIACFALAIGSLLAWPAADAANQPCSGRKGGIAQCDGDTFKRQRMPCGSICYDIPPPRHRPPMGIRWMLRGIGG